MSSRYVRDPQTGALYLKDRDVLAVRAHQETVDMTVQALQDQINTLNARLSQLESALSTGTLWQQTQDQT
jgi:chaperonin cofactor prefoldin